MIALNPAEWGKLAGGSRSGRGFSGTVPLGRQARVAPPFRDLAGLICASLLGRSRSGPGFSAAAD